MSFSKFPYALAVCFALALLFAADASAQTQVQTQSRPRAVGLAPQTNTTTTGQADGRSRLENDVTIISEAADGEAEPEAVTPAPSTTARLGAFEQTMLAAIDARIGIPYRMGSEGPNRYDCSGFVWSVFQTAGVSFERASARTFWHQFAPAAEDEKYKFGTLVFFNHLGHVGIVADENGFYHASSSRGVTYSPFSDYWRKRINGFRRVHLQPGAATQLAAGR